MKKFQVTLYYTLFLLTWGEELSQFKFQCVDEHCSEPIMNVKASMNYDPHHKLKMRVHKGETVSIYGVSSETELLLANSASQNTNKPSLVPPHLFQHEKRLSDAIDRRATKFVYLSYPANFAKTKTKGQTKNLSSSSTKNPQRNVTHFDKLRRFSEAIFYHSMSFPESKKSLNTAVGTQHPRVTYGDSPTEKVSFADNSTDEETSIRTDNGSEDEDDESQKEAVEFYDDLNGNIPMGISSLTSEIFNFENTLRNSPSAEISSYTNNEMGGIPNASAVKADVPNGKPTKNESLQNSTTSANSSLEHDEMMGAKTENKSKDSQSSGSSDTNVMSDTHNDNAGKLDTVNNEVNPSESLHANTIPTNVVDTNNYNTPAVSPAGDTNFNATETESTTATESQTSTVGHQDTAKSADKVSNVSESLTKKNEHTETEIDTGTQTTPQESVPPPQQIQPGIERESIGDSQFHPENNNFPESSTTKKNEKVPTNTNFQPTVNPVTADSETNNPATVSQNLNSVTEPSVRMHQSAVRNSPPPEGSYTNEMGGIPNAPAVIPDVPNEEPTKNESSQNSATPANSSIEHDDSSDTNVTSDTHNDNAGKLDRANNEVNPSESLQGNTIPTNVIDTNNITTAASPAGDTNSNAAGTGSTTATESQTRTVGHQDTAKKADYVTNVSESLPKKTEHFETEIDTGTQTTPQESVPPQQIQPGIERESIGDSIDLKNQFHPENNNIYTSDAAKVKTEPELLFDTLSSVSSSDGNAPQQHSFPPYMTPTPTPAEQMPTSRDSSNIDVSLPGVETSTETMSTVDQHVVEVITDERSVDEKSFYSSAVEYVSTLSINVPNFTEWFSQSETHADSCDREQDCDGLIVRVMDDVNISLNPQVVQIPFLGEITIMEKERMPIYAIVFLCTVFLVIISAFSMFSREWKKKEKNLVAFVNRLEGKLLVSTREISTLEEQMNNVKTRPMVNSLDPMKKEAIKEAFNKQLKQYQDKNSELEDKVTYLEKELESVQNYALEMHKLFENSLTTQSTSRAAIDEVDDLRLLTENQESEIDDLRRAMESVMIENQILKEASENAKLLSKKLEQDYNAQMKKNLELSEKQKELTFKLEKETDNNLTLENEYKSQVYQLRSKLEEVEMKLKRSEFQVEEMSRVITQKQDEDNLDTTKDDSLLRIQVSTLEAMNLDLTNQLKDEKGARRMVEDHMETIIKELNSLKKTFEISEKERKEAVTKLQVLTDYFNNEKTKMHKELEGKEKLLTENESKDQLLSRTMQSLKEEINNYKLQNEALKREISEQEVSYKIQLAKAEQKGRDDWFQLRKTERKYKECQQEAASLRNRILLLESNRDPKEEETNNTGMNGDLNAPPPPLSYPLFSPDMLPLPADFMPPPPSPPLPSHSVEFEPPIPPLYSPDERLPPLGGRRVPSPPNSNPDDDDEFTPPPPILLAYTSNRNRNEMSSSYMRTMPHPSRQRSSQFNSRRQRSSVDSPSSGLSVESLDKTR